MEAECWCPGRLGNEEIHPCLQRMADFLVARNVTTVGRWADPAAHVNYLVLDAPNAHIIQGAFMESGLCAHTTAQIRPILSMD